MKKLKCIYAFFLLLLFFSQKLQASNFNTSQPLFELVELNQDVLYSDCPLLKRYCKGKMEWHSGDKYSGEFSFGKPHGKGILTYANGSSYEGKFHYGVPNGFGKMIYEDKSVYEGEWLDGLKHGEGAYSYVCGDEFYGNFQDDQIKGYGTILFSNGESYSGNWENNLPEDYGVFSRNDGSQFAGMSRSGEKDGPGMIIWAKGDTLKGTWSGGKIEDDATFVFNDGSTMVSFWEDGKLIDGIFYTTSSGQEFRGSQKEIASIIIQENYSEIESIENNLQLAWLGFAMEYKANNDLESAKNFLQLAIEIKEMNNDSDDDNQILRMVNSQFAQIQNKMDESEVASANKN